MRRAWPKRHKCPITARAHPLARDLFHKMNEQRASITDVAERAGISLATMVKWKQRHSPNIETLEAAGNVLGYRLRWIAMDDPRYGK